MKVHVRLKNCEVDVENSRLTFCVSLKKNRLPRKTKKRLKKIVDQFTNSKLGIEYKKS